MKIFAVFALAFTAVIGQARAERHTYICVDNQHVCYSGLNVVCTGFSSQCNMIHTNCGICDTRSDALEKWCTKNKGELVDADEIRLGEYCPDWKNGN